MTDTPRVNALESNPLDSFDFRAWKTLARELERELIWASGEKAKLTEIVAARPEVGAPITQCLTAGAVNSTTEGTRLVCAKCGQQHLMAMGLFDYDLNQYADYPTEHPDRCLKLDGKFYDPPIMEQGKSRPHWRCHKKAGHDSTNGGMHCSTHRDCGARIGDPGDRGICGNEPLHDNGIHEAHSSPQKACIECKLGDGQHAAHCSNREPHDPIRR